MSERPILFSGAMVRAILAGRKTQTRRIVKPQPIHAEGIPFASGKDWEWKWGKNSSVITRDPATSKRMIEAGKFQIGDRLWVREAWCSGDTWFNLSSVEFDTPQTIRYRADNSALHFRSAAPGDSFEPDMYGWSDARKWKPGIHMFRWMSRLTLEVTDVRVERLTDISEEDARAEGIEELPGGFWTFNQGLYQARSARDAFAALWESINGAGTFANSPWVWVVSFARMAAEPLRGTP